jgi:hypothetical protein
MVNMDMNAVVVSADALLNEQFTRFVDRWDSTSRRISQEHGSSVLTNVSEFISKIPNGYSFHSGWSGLVDLTLEGRALRQNEFHLFSFNNYYLLNLIHVEV